MRVSLRMLLCVGAAAAGCLSVPAAAASSRVPTFAGGGVDSVRRLTPEQRQERRFLQDASANLRFTSMAAKLALEKSQAPAVVALAKTLIAENEDDEKDLRYLLHVRAMTIPMLAADQNKVLKALGRSAGRRFDRTFLEEVGLRAQSAALRDAERMALAAPDPAVREWAQGRVAAMRDEVALAGRSRPLSTVRSSR